MAENISHPTLWRELLTVRYANVFIFALAMAGCVFFTTGLSRARAAAFTRAVPPPRPAVRSGALHLLGLALLVLSLGRELPVAAPRADTLLLALLLLAMGLVLRLRSDGPLWRFPVLGVTLGAAYLTKSFAFLPSVALVAGLFLWALLRRGRPRTRLLSGAALTAVLFAATAGPYVAAISRQLGHLTTGDSARLNYAFFIDGTARWHEWYHHELGHATGPFLHPEQPIAGPPPVFSYAAHPFGTFPLWFDPAWWTAGLKPHVWMHGHVVRFARNCVVFLRYLLGRPEPIVLLLLLGAFGAHGPHHGRRQAGRLWWALVPAGWGLLMLAIYFPIDLQDRYLTAPFLFVLLSIAALLELRPSDAESDSGEKHSGKTPTLPTATVATAMIVLFAMLTLSQAVTYLAERRRQTSPANRQHPGVAAGAFGAAAALARLGLQPGDHVACMGDRACDFDHYWARLAGTQILAEVETPGEANPQIVWEGIADTSAITGPLRRLGLRYLVTVFPNSARKPDGWVQLGTTDFFAYPLQPSAAQAHAGAASHGQP